MLCTRKATRKLGKRSAMTRYLPELSESLKINACRDLRAVGRHSPDEAIAVVLEISIKITEAEFGIDVPRDLAADPSVGLRRNVRTGSKAADVHPSGKIKSFG